MDPLISLSIENLEIDWRKSWNIQNHSRLFLLSDISAADYHYFDWDSETPVVIKKAAFARPLRDMMRRLELLGYTVERCRHDYAQELANVPVHYDQPLLDFDSFMRILIAVNPSLVRLPETSDWDIGEFAARSVLSDPEFTKSSKDLVHMNNYQGTFFENLDPYITLRLLAENESNLDSLVVWRPEEALKNDLTPIGAMHEGLTEANRILVVTEGSTDSTILKKSLPYVAPDVADFFTFIDMENNYPFTGAGNLVRFCQGLTRIRIQNRIVVILDNDTAGRAAYSRICDLDLPNTMTVMLLPDRSEFTNIRTLGPSGEMFEDINGKAVSIEFFLDLGYQQQADPTVRWTSYDSQMRQYQGALENKEAHVRSFLKSISQPDYHLSNLKVLWNCIIETCKNI